MSYETDTGGDIGLSEFKQMNKKLENNGDVPGFAGFAVKVFPMLSTGGFHAVYYRVLEAFAMGIIKRLIVTVPPQHGKSLGSSILLPAYLLGLDPSMTVAIGSYSASLANRFNKRVQRIIDSPQYAAMFPDTCIKRSGNRSDYVRTADRVEVIEHGGELLSVGREGGLTGNRVDCIILDDLYKDAMEANSPVIRENCWEWYTSVVKTRLHNLSRELIVFTRWHEEDLIGMLAARERVVELCNWAQLGKCGDDDWMLLNFEAVKASPPTELDPRCEGDSLWEERHSKRLLEERRKLDPFRFECMYQGHPSASEGLLYGNRFRTYDRLPEPVVRYANYTDTADTGADYLCSVCYAIDRGGKIYVTDVVYSQDEMGVTEGLVAAMIGEWAGCDVLVESNNGGRGFARALARLCPHHSVNWFYQSANKEARILSNSATVLGNLAMPKDWIRRWPDFARHLTTYRRVFRSNRWHDAADVLTGIVEREFTSALSKKIHALSFTK